MKKCTGMEAKLAEMLLAPETVPAKVQTHVDGCAECQRELEELRATMALMDEWKAPEPNPYFMTQFEARMSEERRAPRAGWLERLHARWTYNPHLQSRPLAALALTVMMLLGGGAYLGLSSWEQPKAPAKDAAVVHDLQTLENNAQLLDQLESITDNDNSSVMN
ncbi:MAG: hypothetical protein KGN79_14635 [Acidobacteriota bacterium]|nr:hypothetical protein [Acidobacteriota bacterium]